MNNNIDFDEDGFISTDSMIDEDTELCPSVQMFAGMILSDKPLGFFWPREEMVEFLRKLDYRIIEQPSDIIPIQIAVKKDEDTLPSLDKSNIEEVFGKEVRGILLEWLLKAKKGK